MNINITWPLQSILFENEFNIDFFYFKEIQFFKD